MRVIDEHPPTQRILLASNRLPVRISEADDGSFDFAVSDGGLVSGIGGFSKSTKAIWYGWTGTEVKADQLETLKRRLKEEHHAVPVLLSKEVADHHYNGFSSLCAMEMPGEITFEQNSWEAYTEANRIFANTIANDAQDGDFVWIHDFHLLLVPAMLRAELKKRQVHVKIGFFLHVPWPSSEVYRVLPVREELLEGALGSDLIGFHTSDYLGHFLGSCSRILNLHTAPNGVYFDGHFVTTGVYPIGIDPSSFDMALKDPDVQTYITSLKATNAGFARIIGVDRLDYIKAVPHKLHGFEVFLDRHPEWHSRVQLVQIAVPTRLDVKEYRHLRKTTNELSGRINAKFGTPEWTPVVLMFKSISFKELVAYYATAAVCLVTSSRDGMNLVCLEYIAAQRDAKGVLILSEFAGAAKNLTGYLSVSPYDTGGMAHAIHEALTMSKAERETRFTTLDRFVREHTSSWWGKAFISELSHIAHCETSCSIGNEVEPRDELKVLIRMSGDTS